MIKHFEGETKLDSEGMPFYETLGNRSVYKKELLHITDTLTTDGSMWNKFDIFDSDGKDVGVGRLATRLVVSLAPLLIPKVG
jgi:hypothetical protein